MSAVLWFQTIVGIFCVGAFFLISFYLKKNQLAVGPWILLSFATACLTVAEYARAVLGNEIVHSFLITVGFIMIFLVAVFKFWDIMELVHGY